MVITIVKILLLIFATTILMLLAAYSTVVEARAKRTVLVYEIVTGVLIVSENNFMLGLIELIIFQVMIIFSLIATIYAYANVEIINKSKHIRSNSVDECTALISVPFRRGDIEVTKSTIKQMKKLTYYVFSICTIMLILIRPVLLFPFYTKNWLLFMTSLSIVCINFWIASESSDSPRAINSFNGTNAAVATFMVLLLNVIVFLIAYGVYNTIDSKLARYTTFSSEPEICGEMLPISERYDYAKDLPSNIRDCIDINDQIYLIDYAANPNRGYRVNTGVYLNIGEPNLLGILYYDNGKEAVIHLISDDIKPYVTVSTKEYTNLKGETKVSKTIYDIYIQKERILTY